MKNFGLLITLTILSLLTSEIAKYALDLNSLLYQSLSETYGASKVQEAFIELRKWQLWGYMAIPVLLFIKTQLVAVCLSIASFLFDREIRYRTLWGIALWAEFVFLPVALMKISWFLWVVPEYTLEEVQAFYPLSLLSLIGTEGLDPWLYYPLQLVNAFELTYWVALALMVAHALKDRFAEGFKIVAAGYGTGLLLWTVAVMFLILNFS